MPIIAYTVKLTPAQIDAAGRILRVRWTLIDANDARLATGIEATADAAEQAGITAGLVHAETSTEPDTTPDSAADLEAHRAAREAIDKASRAP